jgi:hypothetical protein
VQKDPSLRHVRTAVKAPAKAIAASEDPEDPATRTALNEAQATLSACLQLNGARVPTVASSGGRRSSAAVEDMGSTLLDYVSKHPGQRGEQIAKALNTDVKTMSCR